MKRLLSATLACSLVGLLGACSVEESRESQAEELVLKACGAEIGSDPVSGEITITDVDYGTDYSWAWSDPVDQISKVKNRDEQRAIVAKRAERLDPYWSSLSDNLETMYEEVWKVWSIRNSSTFSKEALTGTLRDNFLSRYGDYIPTDDAYSIANGRAWLECSSLFDSLIERG